MSLSEIRERSSSTSAWKSGSPAASAAAWTPCSTARSSEPERRTTYIRWNERAGPEHPRGQARHQRLELGDGAGGVTGAVQEPAVGDAAQGEGLDIRRRSQPAGPVQQVGGGIGGTSAPRLLGGSLERHRHLRVRCLRGGGQMTGPFLQVVREHRHGPVQVPPARRGDRAVRSGGQDRVGESHAFGIHASRCPRGRPPRVPPAGPAPRGPGGPAGPVPSLEGPPRARRRHGPVPATRRFWSGRAPGRCRGAGPSRPSPDRTAPKARVSSKACKRIALRELGDP